MFNPVATYRVQLHSGFTIKDLSEAVAYLKELGVRTIYASPIFKSVPGSTHGYDGLDPNEINPEIGSIEELYELSGKLKEAGIGWIQDIVPNHMAFHPDNKWLMDVLEKGEQSAFYSFFDIRHGEKLMVPFLGCSLEEAIERREVTIIERDGKFAVKYFDSMYPLRTDSVIIDPAGLNETGEIRRILDEQHYRLCHWQETDTHINYRRFFTVNGLICMNMQDENVFRAYHSLVEKLVKEKVFQGLRVDHVDGLYDPADYAARLRQLAGEDVYIIVEKILAENEYLPDNWPLEGNSGYDVLAMINNLLTDKAGLRTLSRAYYTLANNKATVADQYRDKKRKILFEQMGGELHNLVSSFLEITGETTVSYDGAKAAIASLLVNMPVYRFYGNSMPLQEHERRELTRVFRIANAIETEQRDAIELLEKILIATEFPNPEFAGRVAHFYQRLMQFTGPLMAKGVEDTLMYTFNRLISRNEVGDSPGSFGMSVSQFHERMTDRQDAWPLSMNTTATHDTKRGEDARARLNVVSSISEEWIAKVREWMRMNAHLKQGGAPDINDEYFIYQALLGSWPFGEENANDFSERFTAYIEKALRESKLHSNWTSPNEAYENAVKGFAVALLKRETDFWKSFKEFHSLISIHGIVNSVSQMVLKFTIPGVPDVYQGCELWDLSFVDPDNRRPVDYGKRHELMTQVQEMKPGDLWHNATDGKIKLWLTQYLYHLRSEYSDVFEGRYQPVGLQGLRKEHAIAYARVSGETAIIIVLPLFTARLNEDVQAIDWADTSVVLPDIFDDCLDLVNEKTLDRNRLILSELFGSAPFAILKARVKVAERKAGVLLPVFSLHSNSGIGDLGPSAYRFIDLLSRSGQKLWQMLPVNPTSEAQAYSPYSSYSSLAGNPLLISPEELVSAGWLDTEDLRSGVIPAPSVDYKNVESWKNETLHKAWRKFQNGDQSEFNAYAENQEGWLDDLALFLLLKQVYQGKPWNEWPQEYKDRNEKSLFELREQHYYGFQKIKWVQWIFHQQWEVLKQYANKKGIQLVGDLPFYVGYDSVDVWVNRELFALNVEGNMTHVAGVPPDAFSEDGQLWGMPVFNWEKMRERNYEWWIRRIKKNMEWFDLLRLDHFRAFSAYWEVNASDETARNGKWVETPGSEFFSILKNELGSLPFIAEDLGDIDEPVRVLRKETGLPGMKVLQFAFGDDHGRSEFMPHQHSKDFIVYTGTHDNNTMKGWWNDEADDRTKKRVKEYSGTDINENNVAEYFCRLAFSSACPMAIVPMQDVLGLGSEARMNRPSSTENNWSWKLMPGQLDREVERKLRKWTRIYGR